MTPEVDICSLGAALVAVRLKAAGGSGWPARFVTFHMAPGERRVAGCGAWPAS